ncbi:lipoprotein signal peptidase [Fulvivirga kasyanovii]|uniref:Lipoprotein signal peptidase n=1 Tax=Fulvivirga kasyanovii TaxID=396812 RepID=A0ABW9RPZ6_9BACT|nr:lipoprotein signal peptidase [Fulvivirga kasyanovii]MTI25035.1 lipoprotein signal peptidase [Fulvivirga kasyanovii]
MKLYKYYILALGVIILDQVVKLLVHFNMEMGTMGEIDVFGEWFKLHYLLNPGMAFGLKSSHEYGKLLLTLFRLGAMVGIGYYIYYLFRKKAKPGLLWCMGLILGGAVGNVIDSTFYGVFLDNAPAGSPTPWFHGQVIDMLFFPLFDGYYPDWVPFVGGDYFLFFSPVFNIADSSIFIGVVLILIFQKKFFKDRDDQGTITDTSHEEDHTDKESKEVIVS